MQFAMPMICMEGANNIIHHDDFYFCRMNIMSFSAKNKQMIVYPILDSAHQPVKHDDTLHIPIFQNDKLLLIEYDMQIDKDAPAVSLPSVDPEYSYEGTNVESKIFSQEQLNDLARD